MITINKKLRIFCLICFLIGAFVAGCILQLNWLSRHPYWAFFHIRTILGLRIAFSGFVLTLLLFLIRSTFNYLLKSSDANSQKRFLIFDAITYLALPCLLLLRMFIPGRMEGNNYYLKVAVIWLAIKPIAVIVLTKPSSLKLILKLFFSTPSLFKYVKSYFFKKVKLNTLFFIFLFIYLLSIGLLFQQLLSIGTNQQSFFIVSTLTYTLFAFFCFLVLNTLIQHHAPGKILYGFIGISCLLFFGYWFDYMAFRLVNMHLSGCISILFGEGFAGITKVIEGADVSLTFAWSSAILFLILPLSGIFLYHLSDKISSKKPFYIRLYHPMMGSLCCLGLVFISDWYLHSALPTTSIRKFEQTAPLNGLFFKSRGDILSFDHFLSPPNNEEKTLAFLETVEITARKKPHIFIFVIESLREGFVTDETAPCLFDFKNTSLSFDLALSNSNITYNSHFTLFNSIFPYHWYSLRNNNLLVGSIPLNILKKVGYDINVFVSSYIDYYGMGEVIFGKDYSLLTTKFEARERTTDIAERDRLIIEKLKDQIANIEKDSSSINLIFLDSTHHNYYWPESFTPKFIPYGGNFNYLGSAAKQLEMTKNRYRNSILYVDGLFKQVCEAMQEKGIYDDSIIIVTGDHGEEFLEQGHYFHGNALCLPQSHVVLYYKFPGNFVVPKTLDTHLTSHIDVFPTLLDYLRVHPYPKGLVDGESLFKKEWPYVISVKPGGGKNPYHFYLHNGKYKVEARFNNIQDIYVSDAIEILGVTDDKDNPILLGNTVEELKSNIISEFGDALNRMFDASAPKS